MDPRDFRTLAVVLVKPGAPANNRTAIGRAYYAAFNVALNHLRAEGFQIKQNNSAHEEVTRHLAWSNDADVQRAGSQIQDLRGKRNKADYKLTVIVSPMERVFRRNIGHLGAGLHWFQYRGEDAEHLVFEEGSWFYDISPEWRRMVHVRP